MVRHFGYPSVPVDTVERVLNLARLGPSADSQQAQENLVVAEESCKAEIVRLLAAEIPVRFSVVHRRVLSMSSP